MLVSCTAKDTYFLGKAYTETRSPCIYLLYILHIEPSGMLAGAYFHSSVVKGLTQMKSKFSSSYETDLGDDHGDVCGRYYLFRILAFMVF